MNDVAATNKWIGQRTIRPDGVDKVTGTAQYGADGVMPGMVWGKILRSPHAHANIKKIDTSKAAALKGVVAVMTGDERWANVRPPLVEMPREQGEELLETLRSETGFDVEPL